MKNESTSSGALSALRRIDPAQALLIAVSFALVASLVLLALTEVLDVLKAVNLGDGAGSANDHGDGFQGIGNAIEDIRGPATATVGGVGSLGVLAGSAMLGVGSPKGMKVLGSGAFCLGGIGLGNGVLA